MKQQKKLWEELEESIKDKMDNRTKVLNPFQLDVFKHIYQVALDAEEWAAFNFLNSREVFRGVIDKTSTAETTFIMNDLKVKFSVSFSDEWRGRDDCPDVVTDWDRIHPKAREYIMRWVMRDRELTTDKRYVSRRMSDLGENCNTWGQVARCWPQLASYFPGDMKRKYNRRKAASALPDGRWIMTEEGTVILDSWCEPDYYEHATELIAEAMLLPEYSRERFGVRPSTRVNRVERDD